MGKKEGCNKMNKKVHFVTAPFYFHLKRRQDSSLEVFFDEFLDRFRLVDF